LILSQPSNPEHPQSKLQKLRTKNTHNSAETHPHATYKHKFTYIQNPEIQTNQTYKEEGILANAEENEVNKATKVEQNSQTKKSEEFLMLLGEDFIADKMGILTILINVLIMPT
jgi:hypothetical protein